MTTPTDRSDRPPRRFSEEEVREILTRAASMQTEGGAAGDSRAMTLAEIEQAAAEAGLDRALVRRAAAEVAVPDVQARAPARPHPLVGAPSRLLVEAMVPGTLDAEDHPALLNIIQDAMGAMGDAQSMGSSLTWSLGATPTGRQLMVSVRSEDGVTRVRAEEDLSTLLGGYFGGLLGGLGGGGLGFIAPLAIFLASAVSVATVPVLVGGWLGGVYLLARRLYRKKVEGRRAQLEALVEALASRCARAALPAGEPAGG